MSVHAVLLTCFAGLLYNVAEAQQVKIPPAFSVGVEVILPAEKNIHYRKNLLDRDRRISLMDLSLPQVVDDFGNFIEKSEIDVIDLNYNVLHVENKTTTQCEVYMTDSELVDYFYDIWYQILRDVYNLENGSHKYIGTVKIRGRSVDANMFQRVQSSLNPFTGTNITSSFTWFLLDPAWTEVGSGDNTQGHRRPMMFQLSSKDGVNPAFNVTVNYFDWSFRKPYLSQYSISNCYGSKFRKEMMITFSSSGTLTRKLQISEVDMIAEAIAKAIDVSMLRISQNTVSQNGNSVTFTTSLLADAYEIRKSDIFLKKGKFLQTAYNDLINMAKSGKIRVSNVAGVTLTSTGAQDALKPANKHMYGPGDMAGLAIGMLVAGILIVVVLGAVLIQRKTGQNPMEFIKFQNEKA